MPEKQHLPVVGLGPVVWRPQPGMEPSAAIATTAGSVVNVLIFPTDVTRGIVKETVRHVSDPEYQKYAHLGNGVWDYTDEQKLLMTLARPAESRQLVTK